MVFVDYTDMEHYIDYMEEHGRRPKTVETTRILLRHILRALAEHSGHTTIETIDLDDIRWLYTAFPGCSEATRTEYVRYVSRMCVCQGGQDWIKRLDVLHNRTERKRTWITLEEFAVLYQAADPTDRMILVLGAFMGLRRFEIAGLADADIDLDRSLMTVRGKGHGRDGLMTVMEIPFAVRREIEAYRAYKAATFPTEAGQDHLIQSCQYKRWRNICTNWIGVRIRELGKTNGIHATVHSLRRLYATTLANDVDADLDVVRRLMRHADIATTLRCYIYPDPTKPRQASIKMDAILEGIAAQ